MHFELLQYWRREKRCKHNPECPTQHQEWFEIDVETAARIMDNFARWLTVAKPYDERGVLTARWHALIKQRRSDRLPVTSQFLVDALHSTHTSGAIPPLITIIEPRIPSPPRITALEETPSSPVPLQESTDPDPVIETVASAILSLQSEQLSRLQALLDNLTPPRRSRP